VAIGEPGKDKADNDFHRVHLIAVDHIVRVTPIPAESKESRELQ
jgi:hypothetical protein